MPSYQTEYRSLPKDVPLSLDLAKHIFARNARGCVVVAADKPQDVASVVKKQWHALMRLVQRERSSTIRLARIAELTNQLSWMQNLHFTAKFSGDYPDNSIIFATIDDLIKIPPSCSTLYLTCAISTEELHMITSWLPNEGVMVAYKR